MQLLEYRNYYWNKTVEKYKQEAEKNTDKNAMLNVANQVFEERRRELDKLGENASTALYDTIVYFFEKLDKLFTKHNQYPY